MRICIIFRSDSPKKEILAPSLLTTFRGVEIYSLKLPKKTSKRKFRAAQKSLLKQRISLVAIEDEATLPPFSPRSGITAFDGERCFSGKTAEAALLISEKFTFPKRFHIHGGSFFTVVRCALRLLRDTSDVFVSCADFDAVSDACLDACGAVIKSDTDCECINIFLAEKDILLSFGEKTFSRRDFKIILPPPLRESIPLSCHAATASLLEVCGVLDAVETIADIL